MKYGMYIEFWAQILAIFLNGKGIPDYLLIFMVATQDELNIFFLIQCLSLFAVAMTLQFFTQPDWTLFFLIFAYLWSTSHWSFINYGSNAAIYNFFKPETNKGEFKSCMGHHNSEISKTKTKTMIFSMDANPGVPGVSKQPEGPKDQ